MYTCKNDQGKENKKKKEKRKEPSNKKNAQIKTARKPVAV
jgi:hypothetical protein